MHESEIFPALLGDAAPVAERFIVDRHGPHVSAVILQELHALESAGTFVPDEPFLAFGCGAVQRSLIAFLQSGEGGAGAYNRARISMIRRECAANKTIMTG